MSFNIRYLTSVLLFISFGLLSILVPGGPIETRSFSHIDPLILGGFNPFLTSLAMISVFLIYFILKDLKVGVSSFGGIWSIVLSGIRARSRSDISGITGCYATSTICNRNLGRYRFYTFGVLFDPRRFEPWQ